MALVTAPTNGYHNGVDGVQDTLYHCMKDYKHGPNSRMSITFNSSKGLTNAPGQNNCFLNSAVQVLWHLDAFRRSFRLLSGHSCMGNACIFCALKVMFTQFQYSDKQVLPPDTLRQALSETFQNQQRFQMGFMDDAAECFENILTRMHNHIASEESEDSCTAPHCIPHRKFSMSVSEQVVCGSCRAKSEPFTFNEMVFYVSTGALVNEFKSNSSEELSNLSFSQLLKSTVSKGDIRSCPNNCGELGEKKRDLTNVPDVVSIGLVWESAKSGSQHIRDVVNCIGTTLNLEELFHSTPASGSEGGRDAPPLTPLHLVGVVCYYGKHYSTFFFHSKVHEWIYFDDASVKQISPSWSKVCEKLCKGRHQPLLLLYMNPNTEAVDVTTAPKYSTMAPGYEWKNEEHNEPNSLLKNSVPDVESYHHQQLPRRVPSEPPSTRLDKRYDEVDESYAARHYSKDRYADRQVSNSSSALSRQDSGVSTHSSRSQISAFLEGDSVSGISSMLTQHSSDSGSSGHQVVTRQESDTASSYCSRSSRTSTLSTFSSAVESEDTGYVGLHSYGILGYQSDRTPEKKKNKEKVSLKKKKMKNRLDADVMRYHSKSQVSLLDVHNQSYDDSSLTRTAHTAEDVNQNSISYATLPRKKRATSATPQPAALVKSPEAILPPKGSDDKASPHSDTHTSISSRIQLFNGMSEQTVGQKATAACGKPPELKPLLHINEKDRDGPSYISKSSVEKILNQQRKALSRGSIKMMRPTYDEQFVLPEEYTYTSDNKGSELKLDFTSDNTSLSSLKDSGYRSMGDRGSNSASSISSLSAESPTVNRSFQFDTREHIYCEPAPLSLDDSINQDDPLHADSASDDFDFPPPPAELLSNGSNHCKQLSEASLLSEASTVKHRKTPSVESLTALPDTLSESLLDKLNNLSLSDSKLKGMIQSAEEFLQKSLGREERNELSTSLAFCRQSVSLLNSVLNQKPESKQLVTLVQSKHEYCSNRVQHLLTKVVGDSDDDREAAANSTASSSGKHVMTELYIDNQTKREAASSDYTPLHNAIHKAPNSGRENTKPRRLSRTDSQLSNCSSTNSSTGHHSVKSAGTAGSSDRVIHTVPPKLQYSISQLKQKQQQASQMSLNSQQSTHHTLLSKQAQQGYSQSQSYTHGYEPVCHTTTSRPATQARPYCRPTSTTSNVYNDVNSIPKSKPAQMQHSLYKEVNIPTTLQRNDYIREGYKSPSADRNITASPTPSVIPPPKEFQEVEPVPRNNATTNSRNLYTSRMPYSSTAKQTYYPVSSCQMYEDTLPTSTIQSHSQSSYSRQISSSASTDSYKELPAKQNINKQNIREMLVKDMLKRQGQSNIELTSHSNNKNGLYTSSQPYIPQYEEPLWIPPQPSAFDKGLSHYDRPNYHRKNIYGQVVHKPDTDYMSNYQPQHSLYGENMLTDNRQTYRQQSEPGRIHHSHTYSTEL